MLFRSPSCFALFFFPVGGHRCLFVAPQGRWAAGTTQTKRVASIGNPRCLVVYRALFWAAYSCSMELCLDMPGEAARRYLNYFMHHINLLRHYKIMPVVVFDGGSIPCKSATDHERHRQVKGRSRNWCNLAVLFFPGCSLSCCRWMVCFIWLGSNKLQ